MSSVWSQHWPFDTCVAGFCRWNVLVGDRVSAELVCDEDHHDGGRLLVHGKHTGSGLFHGTWCIGRMAIHCCSWVPQCAVKLFVYLVS